MTVETVVVVAGGPGFPERPAIPCGAAVVAADEGARHALALGLAVDVAVGDFDSLPAADLEALHRSDARVETHPRAKDETDLELAFRAALELAPRRILLVGGAGGRLDHLLGSVALLAADAYAGVELDALLGPASLHVVRRRRALVGEPGELVSLLALNAPAVGVVTGGLEYPLRGETLHPGSSRGLSNVFAAREATVELREGVVLAVRPGAQ